MDEDVILTYFKFNNLSLLELKKSEVIRVFITNISKFSRKKLFPTCFQLLLVKIKVKNCIKTAYHSLIYFLKILLNILLKNFVNTKFSKIFLRTFLRQKMILRSFVNPHPELFVITEFQCSYA